MIAFFVPSAKYLSLRSTIHQLCSIRRDRTSTKMARLYGRSPYGQRCVAALPLAIEDDDFVGALRATGMTARWSRWPHGWFGVRGLRDTSLCDAQARRHRGDGQSGSTQAAESLSQSREQAPGFSTAALFARLTDRNGFAKLKAALRKAAARSIEALVNAIAIALAPSLHNSV